VCVLCRYYHLDKSRPWRRFTREVLRLFSNARLYNAEDSQIYADSLTMEAAFKTLLPSTQASGTKKIKQKQGSSVDKKRSRDDNSNDQSGNDPVTERMQRAIAAIRACKERRRILSEHFEELPSRAELPDYYAIVKQPVDLQTIESQVEKG
jgi:protein polybromo-1